LSSYAIPSPKPSTLDRLKSAGSSPDQKEQRSAASQGINPGNYVRHEKYGRGLVLRREGSGDNAKLTVSFPGFGQKKLIEKYANLQKD
jgi:DNA helicase-2/ATP-dependent DNA helicase PcrA